MSRNWTQKFNARKINDMDVARSGHGCSLLTSDRSQIIVSGEAFSELKLQSVLIINIC